MRGTGFQETEASGGFLREPLKTNERGGGFPQAVGSSWAAPAHFTLRGSKRFQEFGNRGGNKSGEGGRLDVKGESSGID